MIHDRYEEAALRASALEYLALVPDSDEIHVPAPTLFVIPTRVRETAYPTLATAPHIALVLDGELRGRRIRKQVEGEKTQYFVPPERTFLTAQLEARTWKLATLKKRAWRLLAENIFVGDRAGLDRFLDGYGVSVPENYAELSGVVLDASMR